MSARFQFSNGMDDRDYVLERHLNVNCDGCREHEFKGRRFKCLICFDIDLCERCHSSGANVGTHNSSHPMQCILSKKDISLYFGGDLINSSNTHSFTCPICGKMGFTLVTFVQHTVDSHTDCNNFECICPVCVVLGTDENHINFQTRNLAYHMISRHPLSEHQEMVPLEAIFNTENVDFHAMSRRATFRVFSRLDSLAALDRTTRSIRHPHRVIEKTQPDVKLGRVLSFTKTDSGEKSTLPATTPSIPSNHKFLCDEIVDEREQCFKPEIVELKAKFAKDILYASLEENN